MKRLTISILLAATFAVYAAYIKLSGAGYNAPPILFNNKQTNSLPANNPTPAITQQKPITQKPAAKPAPTPAPVIVPQNNGQYRDGEYTGNVEDAFYGNVQVKVVISGGQISDVQFLDYPQDRNTSVRINSQAMPYLKQEAIQAQSANVDIISGATATSQAFIQSLATALSQAV
jgi:uncharacterized protein with FMN-binding domain